MSPSAHKVYRPCLGTFYELDVGAALSDFTLSQLNKSKISSTRDTNPTSIQRKCETKEQVYSALVAQRKYIGD